MDGNTVIGFCHESSKAYCSKCDKVFVYHWNGCKPLSEDKRCPTCGNYDDVESENHIESHICTLKMMRSEHMSRNNEEHVKSINHKISELHKIRRKFDEYDRTVD